MSTRSQETEHVMFSNVCLIFYHQSDFHCISSSKLTVLSMNTNVKGRNGVWMVNSWDLCWGCRQCSQESHSNYKEKYTTLSLLFRKSMEAQSRNSMIHSFYSVILWKYITPVVLSSAWLIFPNDLRRTECFPQ